MFPRQHRRVLRSQFGKETATSKAESVLAFLVESGAFYLCIWVHFDRLLYLTSGLILSPRQVTFIAVAAAGSPVVLYFRLCIVQIVVRSPSLCIWLK
jgi:hypothetical protein